MEAKRTVCINDAPVHGGVRVPHPSGKSVLPFDVNVRYPAEIAGVKMENYIAWMKSTYLHLDRRKPRPLRALRIFPKAACRSESRSSDGTNDDWGVLQLGYAFEQATNIGERRPEVV